MPRAISPKKCPQTGVIDRDNEQRFPADEVRQLGELGFMGMMVDPKYGGSGMDTVSYVLAMEELSKIDASASVCVSVNNSPCVEIGDIRHGGTEGKVPQAAGHR